MCCMSNTLVTLDRTKEAKTWAKKSTMNSPENPQGWLSYARISLAEGNNPEVVKYCNKALELDPYHEIAWNINR
eukprot:UN18760